MSARLKKYLAVGVFLAAIGPPIFAQSVELLPEVDLHLKLNSSFRAYLQAKDDRDGGAQSQLSVGPSLQFYLKPQLKLKNITAFDLDDAKPRPLVLEVGYRSVTAPDTPPTNRLETILLVHFPLKAGFLMADRNRADLDWKQGGFTWRYRNKLTIERTVAIFAYHLIPYVAVEPYYVAQYGKWSTTALYAGALFPAGKHLQFGSYYEHENDTGKSPNKQVNSIGLELNVYFSLPKK